MANKYLEKIAEQKYRSYGQKVKDTELAAGGAASAVGSRLMTKLIPHPYSLGLGVRAGVGLVHGRSLSGIAREEVRGGATGVAKGIGYGAGGALAGAALGAIAGKIAGNRRVAKFGANLVGKTVDFGRGAALKRGIPMPSGRDFLDFAATVQPEATRKILSDKHLGAKVGAGLGAAAGTIGLGAVGAVKGNYDGRLASIRNQIREGDLKNVILTEKNK